MKKHRFGHQEEPDFSVGFPLGVIAVLMLGITAYLVALNAEIPPPQTIAFIAEKPLP
ncbi:hypothetical protein [Mycoplana sp. MJR14]|jgi:hypothetical protein|uniref:hypothetical protein n=1 Tax=Mycoplana sp. MJR14 TaxID=3032583 RepID=UPI0023D9C376|nr:hypothetical protein [Mycoplana sp. MJR14]MDF1631401.1 hypothetical protein [Mycoplana sp. MJR14]